MHVRRKSGFWFNNVFLPSWIITSSLLSSYGQPAGGGGRLEVSVTVLLTLTTFKFLVAHKLPDVDYMTLMCVRSVCARASWSERACEQVCVCVRHHCIRLRLLSGRSFLPALSATGT